MPGSTTTKSTYANIFDKILPSRKNSSFRIFSDGIGIGSVNFRLSNISLRNLEKNLLLLGGSVLSGLQSVKADCTPPTDFQPLPTSICIVDHMGTATTLSLNTTAIPQLKAIIDELGITRSLCGYFPNDVPEECGYPGTVPCLIGYINKDEQRIAELIYTNYDGSSYDSSQAECLLQKINDIVFPTAVPTITPTTAPHHYNKSYIVGLLALILLSLFTFFLCTYGGIWLGRRLRNIQQEPNVEQGAGNNRLINEVGERSPLLLNLMSPQVAPVGSNSESGSQSASCGSRLGAERSAGQSAFFAAPPSDVSKRKDEKRNPPEAAKQVKKSNVERVEDLGIDPAKDKVLQHGICAILALVMNEPYTLTFKYTAKGVQKSISNTYEKSAIERWINVDGKRIDPKSLLRMDSYILSPNTEMKNLIEERIEHLEEKALAKANASAKTSNIKSPAP